MHSASLTFHHLPRYRFSHCGGMKSNPLQTSALFSIPKSYSLSDSSVVSAPVASHSIKSYSIIFLIQRDLVDELKKDICFSTSLYTYFLFWVKICFIMGTLLEFLNFSLAKVKREEKSRREGEGKERTRCAWRSVRYDRRILYQRFLTLGSWKRKGRCCWRR